MSAICTKLLNVFAGKNVRSMSSSEFSVIAFQSPRGWRSPDYCLPWARISTIMWDGTHLSPALHSTRLNNENLTTTSVYSVSIISFKIKTAQFCSRCLMHDSKVSIVKGNKEVSTYMIISPSISISPWPLMRCQRRLGWDLFTQVRDSHRGHESGLTHAH